MKEFRLESFKLEFKQGYSFKEKEHEKVDRYEGRVEFKNADNEVFILKIDQIKSKEFISLISEQLIKNAETLSDDLKKSLL